MWYAVAEYLNYIRERACSSNMDKDTALIPTFQSFSFQAMHILEEQGMRTVWIKKSIIH